MQFVKNKSIVYQVNSKHRPICKWYIVQILQRLFWTQVSISVRLMKNVTYATPLVAQVNFQKCMLHWNNYSEYNQVNFILLSVGKMHTEV